MRCRPSRRAAWPSIARSDLFSLGSLLYEMVTGISPFRAETAAETLTRICTYEPPAVLDVDPGIPRELAG